MVSVSNSNNYVIFKINDLYCAIHCLDVQEIIRDTSKISSLPQSDDHIQGVINLRGKIVTVINLAKYFHLDATESKTDSIIIIDEEDECIGLLVSEVKDVLDIPPSDIESTPAVPHELDPVYVKSVAEINKELTAILNVKEILKVEPNDLETKG